MEGEAFQGPGDKGGLTSGEEVRWEDPEGRSQ